MKKLSTKQKIRNNRISAKRARTGPIRKKRRLLQKFLSLKMKISWKRLERAKRQLIRKATR